MSWNFNGSLRFDRLLIVWLLFACTLVAAASNQTRPSDSKDDTITCVYPLSGQYGLLPRLLYYASLIFAILARRREWLVLGALASALSFAGTASIHGIALIRSRREVFDLDIYGVWAVLSTGALAYVSMLHWSSALHNFRARLVMVIWGCLIGLGLIFVRAAMFDAATGTEPACRSLDGSLLSSPLELPDARWNCTYKCFDVVKPMRERAETVAVSTHPVMDGKYSGLQLILVGPIMFAAYISISPQFHGHTPSQIYMRAVFAVILKPSSRDELTKIVYTAASERWYGGYMLFLQFVPKDKVLWRKLLYLTTAIPWLALEFLMDVLSPVLLILNIILNELNIVGSGLPQNEAAFAIGQWGPCVSALLIVLASLINRAREMWEAREEAKNSPDIPRNSQTLETFELGQVSGIIKQDPEHQETLRNAEVSHPAGR